LLAGLSKTIPNKDTQKAVSSQTPAAQCRGSSDLQKMLIRKFLQQALEKHRAFKRSSCSATFALPNPSVPMNRVFDPLCALQKRATFYPAIAHLPAAETKGSSSTRLPARAVTNNNSTGVNLLSSAAKTDYANAARGLHPIHDLSRTKNTPVNVTATNNYQHDFKVISPGEKFHSHISNPCQFKVSSNSSKNNRNVNPGYL
jgi:hypothetical protein